MSRYGFTHVTFANERDRRPVTLECRNHLGRQETAQARGCVLSYLSDSITPATAESRCNNSRVI